MIQPQAENLRRINGVIAGQNKALEQQELNQGKIAILKAQAERQRFAAEAVKRQMAVIDAQRFRLEQQRMAKAMEQQRIIMQTWVAKTDSAQATLSRQIDESERAIQKAEAEIEKVNQRLIEKQKAIEDAMKPVRETEAELRKLGYSDWKHHLGRGSFTVEGFTAPEPPASVYSIINGETVRLPKLPVPPAPLRDKPQSIKGRIIKAPKPPVPPTALTIEPAEPAPATAPATAPKPAVKK
ncbi:hypothetical protein [Spirosoma sp. KUDC1026]|uniref:hypothetical protein n=1 Tax=Spirosoma sp. KUDC1026 TaxID=2745947 RepID=UPI00159BBC76|nr:hypothetical protein [Spirosoma sp. KUDC1026]QKZ11875.1 hypothetical protein HU175_04205 [Spirosoma sp. KUDC1026]